MVSGLMGVASEFQNMRSGGNSAVATDDGYAEAGSSSAGSKKRGTSMKGKTSKSDCGSAWMADSKIYSDYETQLAPNGARSASIGDAPAIKSKMKAIRLKWEARGCKINKSPYED